MTGSDDSGNNARPISVAELLAKNGTIGAPPVGGRRRRRRGNSDAVTVAELTGEIPVIRIEEPGPAPVTAQTAEQSEGTDPALDSSVEQDALERDTASADTAAEDDAVTDTAAEVADESETGEIETAEIETAEIETLEQELPARRRRFGFGRRAGKTSPRPAVPVVLEAVEAERMSPDSPAAAAEADVREATGEVVGKSGATQSDATDSDAQAEIETELETALETAAVDEPGVESGIDEAVGDSEPEDELPSYLRSTQGTLFGGQTVADDLARRGAPATPEEVELGDELDRNSDEGEDTELVESRQMSRFVHGLWIVGQCVFSVVFGAGLFVAFDQLWRWNNIIALVLSVLVILGLVVAVRVVRKTEDIGSTLTAVAVGALITLGPLALLQSG